MQGMSYDQQGRYLRALCMSWGTATPGVASEDQWRRWMAYTRRQWQRVRDTVAVAFDTKLADSYDPDDQWHGTWVQKRMVAERAKQAQRYEQAVSGARKSNAAQGRG